MKKRADMLMRHYLSALRRYIARGQEAVLARAYDLGRTALAADKGVLDVARIHQRVLERCQHDAGWKNDPAQAMKSAETFLLEALSPFEITHRGFRESNIQLRRLIASMDQKNYLLKMEIGRRERTEKKLRESRRHMWKLFGQARRMEENLRRLSNEMLHIQEKERQHLSRELHDDVGQALTAVSVTLAVLEHNGDGALAQKLMELQDLLQEAMEKVHGFARDLRPSMLDELGLLPALRSYLEGFGRRTGLHTRFRTDSDVSGAGIEKLGDEQKTTLFRIAQESLTNVAKHAQASRVTLSIRSNGDGFHMKIADNGRSFLHRSLDAVRGKPRLGLLGMQERVRLVNGTLAVLARPGKGTTIHAVIPASHETNSDRSSLMRPGHNGDTVARIRS